MVRMLKYFLIPALIAGVGIAASAQTAPKEKVAVYVTGSDVGNSIKKVLGTKIMTAITSSGDFAAVERTSEFLAALSKEGDIAKLGQKFGAKYVVVVDINEVFDELIVTARLINIESGEIIKSETYADSEVLSSMANNVAYRLINKKSK